MRDSTSSNQTACCRVVCRSDTIGAVTLRFPVLPMKAVLGNLPADAAARDESKWAYEIKWDGYRTLAFVADGQVRLQSTSGKDVTERWPEFGDLPGSVNAPAAILDAELLVFDDDGTPRFELVQQSGRGSDREAVLHVFDVLSVAGTDTIGLPYSDRRQLLTQLLEPGDNWLVPAHRVGDGEALLAATAEQGLEGVIAKRLDSTYRPGARSKDWIKVKNRTRVDVAIGGFTAGEGNRAATFGALLVGRRDTRGALQFAGGVGTGFDQSTLESLTSRLRALEIDDCPFETLPPAKHRRGARWVRPDLTATIEIAEFTNEGYVRHASFIELAG